MRTWAAVNVVGQATANARTRSEVVGSLDFFTDLSMGPAVIHAYLEVGTTPRSRGVSTRMPFANMDAGTALSSEGRGRLQLSELRVAWPVGSGSVVHIGLMDLTGFLDVSRIANDENLHFLAQPFVNNPTIIFPDYVLGATVVLGHERLGDALFAFSLASSHGLADNPDASYEALMDLDAPGKGVFAAGRMEWEGDRWRGSLGVWGSTGTRTDLGATRRPLPTRGLFSVLGWSGDVHSLSGRIGLAAGTGVTEHFVGLTYLGTLGANALGMGIAKTPTLPHFVDSSTGHVEMFLRRRLVGPVHATGSVQRSSDLPVPEDRAEDGAVWIFGFRISAIF